MYYFTSGGDGLAIEYRKLETPTEYSEYLGRHPLAEEYTSREAWPPISFYYVPV